MALADNRFTESIGTVSFGLLNGFYGQARDVFTLYTGLINSQFENVTEALVMQTPDELAQEVEFWREFIDWWELKHGKPAAQRAMEALLAAEARYYEALTNR